MSDISTDIDKENNLIQKYIAEYIKTDDLYNQVNKYYNEKINEEIEKVDNDKNKDNNKIVELTNESNRISKIILEKMEEITNKILSLQTYRDNYMTTETERYMGVYTDKKKQSETISGSDKDKITQNMNDLIKQQNFFNNEVEKYNDTIHEQSNKEVVRKSNEIQVIVYLFIFIGVLCLIARVYVTETVGVIETTILIVGISIIFYYFIEYFNK